MPVEIGGRDVCLVCVNPGGSSNNRSRSSQQARKGTKSSGARNGLKVASRRSSTASEGSCSADITSRIASSGLSGRMVRRKTFGNNLSISLRFIFAHNLDVVLAGTEEPGLRNRHVLREHPARCIFVAGPAITAAVNTLDAAGQDHIALDPRGHRIHGLEDAVLSGLAERQAAANGRGLPRGVLFA